MLSAPGSLVVRLLHSLQHQGSCDISPLQVVHSHRLPGKSGASGVRSNLLTLERGPQGLEEIIVRGARDIYALLDRGSAKRRTAETLLNKQSSRSHSVFCVTARCLAPSC